MTAHHSPFTNHDSPSLVILLYPSKAELLALRRHLDEVVQPLLELGRAVARPFDEADPDALVGRGELAIVGPRILICLDRLQDIPRDHEPWLGHGGQRSKHALAHLARRDQLPQPLLVGRGVWRTRLARREALCEALTVDAAHVAVDPAEAQRLFDRVVVGDARFSAPFAIVDQPDLLRGAMVLPQPASPLCAAFNR